MEHDGFGFDLGFIDQTFEVRRAATNECE